MRDKRQLALHNATQKRWQARHPEKKKYIDKRTCLQKKYGVSVEFKNALIEKQGGCCAICAKPFDQTARKNACLDHIHGMRGEESVRAILCVPCNAGIGNFYEDPELLQAAIDYLEDYA